MGTLFHRYIIYKNIAWDKACFCDEQLLKFSFFILTFLMQNEWEFKIVAINIYIIQVIIEVQQIDGGTITLSYNVDSSDWVLRFLKLTTHIQRQKLASNWTIWLFLQKWIINLKCLKKWSDQNIFFFKTCVVIFSFLR